MYVLIYIGQHGKRIVELVSKTKSKLENYIKDKGFYYSKKCDRYIDDKNCGISGGSGTDYIIEKINEI